VEGIDRPPEIRIAKISKGLQRGLVSLVEQISIGDENHVPFCEPLCRIEVALPLYEIERLMGIEHLQDALDAGQGGLGDRIRIENLQPLKHAIMHLLGQLKSRPGKIRLRIANGSCRVQIGHEILTSKQAPEQRPISLSLP